VKREDLLGVLRTAPGGMSLAAILPQMRIDPHSPEASAVEVLLFLSPEVRLIEGRWRVVERGRGDRVIAAIEAYSSSTGKRVFRATSALEALPLNDQPTIEELADLLGTTSGKYALLPNAIIKRNY
jgi:hypothetical protein